MTLRLAAPVHVLHVPHPGERATDLVRIAGGHQEVEIADGLLAAAHRARHRGLLHAGKGAEPRLHVARDRQRMPEELASGRAGEEPDPAQELLLALRPEVRQGAHALLAAGLLEASHVADPQLFVQRVDTLRPQTLHGSQAEDVDRRAFAQTLERGHPTRGEQFVNLLGKALADPRQPLDALPAGLRVDLGERTVQRVHGQGRLLVGPGLERHLVHLQEERHLPESMRHLGVAHRPPAPASGGSAHALLGLQRACRSGHEDPLRAARRRCGFQPRRGPRRRDRTPHPPSWLSAAPLPSLERRPPDETRFRRVNVRCNIADVGERSAR